ncbi:putative membrane protein [Acinetobacter sp. 479375]|nr:putative membrane protein [Acinetobacter sp. 479375]BBF77082.1 hypothetical protein URS_1056 [Acinetobacter ursingii]
MRLLRLKVHANIHDLLFILFSNRFYFLAVMTVAITPECH